MHRNTGCGDYISRPINFPNDQHPQSPQCITVYLYIIFDYRRKFIQKLYIRKIFFE